MTYWHGGGRIAGAMVLPAEMTGVSRSGDTGVHVTTDRSLAETYASTVDGPAWVYEVEPVGPIEPVASLIPGNPTISYRCAQARIVRRYTLSNGRRARLRAAVGSFADEIDDLPPGAVDRPKAPARRRPVTGTGEPAGPPSNEASGHTGPAGSPSPPLELPTLDEISPGPLGASDQALVDRVGAALDEFARLTGINLDAATLDVFRHAFSAVQAVQVLVGRRRIDEPGGEREAVEFLGWLLYVVNDRLEQGA